MTSGPQQTTGKRKRAAIAARSQRYECTFTGCGKAYSRLEHLQRHQLNHEPKEIFSCDYPGCRRTFVREDLCSRHRERHGAAETRLFNTRYNVAPGSSGPLTSPMSEGSTCGAPEQSGGHLPLVRDSGQTRQHQTHTSASPTQIVGRLRSRSRPWLEGGDMRRTSHRVSRSNTRLPRSTGEDTSLHSPIVNLQNYHDYSTATRDDTNSGQTMSNNTSLQIQNFPDFSFDDFIIPEFGNEGHTNSSAMDDDFANWLFEQPSQHYLSGNPNALGFSNTSCSLGTLMQQGYFADPTPLDNLQRATHHTSDTSSSAYVAPQVKVSQATQQSLISLMRNHFNDMDNSEINRIRETLFATNPEDDTHVLSISTLQHYIGAYWHGFHPQVPILHYPTFSADKVHPYLLLTIILIGISVPNAIEDANINMAADLAYFVAWHLRWHIFKHQDFGPPTKLWTYQALLLLEIYEKTSSTRKLHERAQVHHATTINLMRRGMGLVEEVGHDVFPEEITAEEWWNRWITVEATRRVAYAMFFIDIIHATTFGHAAIMIVHEVRLPLPCEDALWDAASPAEAGRIEASFRANDIKPVMFLEGLKRMLTGREVHSGHFGRTILMSGLLSVSWHMKQRDIQGSSLDASHMMGVNTTWKRALAKSFKFWKRDFDEHHEKMRKASLAWQRGRGGFADAEQTQSADMFYHLSQMSIRVDIVDCEIVAGAKIISGRAVTPNACERASKNLEAWAKTKSAKVAVYHAIQLLKPIIIPGKDSSGQVYTAKNDCILMRPWFTWLAALVVWSYGYCQDGILTPFPAHLVPGSTSEPSTPMNQSLMYSAGDAQSLKMDEITKEAHAFLDTVGGITNPDDLDNVPGRNKCIGVVIFLEIAMHDSKWELLKEGADILHNTVKLLRGNDS